jgi:hypothetical protein
MRAYIQRGERPVGQTVRVSPAAYDALKELASESGRPLSRTLEELVQEAHRRLLWARFAESNRLAQDDPTAAAEEALWSAADGDGLDPDEGIAWDDKLVDAASW